jgi:hypothetical protein
MIALEISHPFNSFLTVESTSDLDSIPSQNRSEGMHVYVLNNNTLYVLQSNLSSWDVSNLQTVLDGYASSSIVSLLPNGGSLGNILAKQSSADYDSAWQSTDSLEVENGIAIGGSDGQALYKSSDFSFDTEWLSLPEAELTPSNISQYLDGYFFADGYSNRSLSNSNNLNVNSDLIPANSLDKNLGKESSKYGSVYAFSFDGALDDGEILHPNQPSFGWNNFKSGLTNLSPTINVNGQDLEATLFYVGNDADGYQWNAVRGPTLYLADTGSAPVSSYRAPFTDGTSAVRFPSTSDKVYQAADASIGDIGTDDYITLVVSNYQSGTTYVSKKEVISTTTGPGWAYSRQGGFNSFRHTDSSGGNSLLTLTASAYTWNIAMICVDRNASTSATCARCYTNGVYSSDVAPFQTYQGSLSSPYPLTIGASGNLSENVQGSVAFVGLWKKQNIFPGGTANIAIMDSLAKTLCDKIIGIYPNFADGYALQETNSRNSDASLSIEKDGITNVFRVSSGWARINSQKGITGYLSEPLSTNLFHFSTTLTNAVWVRSGVSFSTNNNSGPGDGSFYNMNSSNSSPNFFYQDVEVSALNYTYSWYCQAANSSWIYLAVPTLSNVDGYFYLSGSGSTGTIGSSVIRSKIEALGTNNYRVQITFQATAATHRFLCAPASADMTIVTATLSPSLRVGWPQLEQRNSASSVILTASSASVSRAADNLFYYAEGGNHPGNLPRTIVTQFHTDGVSNNSQRHCFRNSSAGISPQEYVVVTSDGYINSSGFGIGDSTQWNYTSSFTIDLANKNTSRLSADTNDIKSYVNTVSFGTDTSAVLPSVNRIGIGAGAVASNTAQIDGIISKHLIFAGNYIPSQEGTGDDL